MLNVHPLTVVDPTVKFGEGVKVYQFATICNDVEIGDFCLIGSSVWIGRFTKIGNGTRIQDKVHISPRAIIGKNVFIGPGVITTDDKNPVVSNWNYKAEPPTILDGASIGAGVVILPGITIGAGAIVGAGAVVTRDVEAEDVVMGIPARSRIAYGTLPTAVLDG